MEEKNVTQEIITDEKPKKSKKKKDTSNTPECHKRSKGCNFKWRMTTWDIKKIMKENPTISSFEEFCAVGGYEPSLVSEKYRLFAERLINMSVIRIKNHLKKQLLESGNYKDTEMLYRLLATSAEAERLKVPEKNPSQDGPSAPVIEIKVDNPDIKNKIDLL